MSTWKTLAPDPHIRRSPSVTEVEQHTCRCCIFCSRQCVSSTSDGGIATTHICEGPCPSLTLDHASPTSFAQPTAPALSEPYTLQKHETSQGGPTLWQARSCPLKASGTRGESPYIAGSTSQPDTCEHVFHVRTNTKCPIKRSTDMPQKINWQPPIFQ